MSKQARIKVSPGSGNVFADLGYKNPELALLKAKLAGYIDEVITEHGWTQKQAADALGIDQPKVSALVRGELSAFSIDRLLRFLIVLDQSIEVSIRQKRRAA